MNKTPAAFPSVNILSFDIEEWFMLEDTSAFPPDEWKNFAPRLDYNTRKVLETLERKNTKGVFYVLGWVAEHYPLLVRDIMLAGHEIGYHTYHHHNIDMFTPDSFETDLNRGLDLLQGITGSRPTYFRAPNFSMHQGNLWAVPILLRNGIKINSSIRVHSLDRKNMLPQKPFKWECKGEHLWEFPLSSFSLGPFLIPYSGSGFFRILPDFLIHHFTGRSCYNMFYFHPRDFDPNPRRSDRLSHFRNFKNALFTKSALTRLEKLVSMHEFTTFASFLQMNYDCEIMPVRL